MLAVTASKFNRRPSELLGIAEREIAFGFDLECADILLASEIEREVQMSDLRAAGMAASIFGGSTGGNASGPSRDSGYEVW